MTAPKDYFAEHVGAAYIRGDSELRLYGDMSDQQRELCRRVGEAIYERGRKSIMVQGDHPGEGYLRVPNVAACNPITLGGEVWIGEIRSQFIAGQEPGSIVCTKCGRDHGEHELTCPPPAVTPDPRSTEEAMAAHNAAAARHEASLETLRRFSRGEGDVESARAAALVVVSRRDDVENAVCWGVDCPHEARVLDKDYAEHVRREKFRYLVSPSALAKVLAIPVGAENVEKFCPPWGPFAVGDVVVLNEVVSLEVVAVEPDPMWPVAQIARVRRIC
jgi:hypothetical protein